MTGGDQWSTPDQHSAAGATMPGVVALAARAISKAFPGVLANDRLDFDVLPGEVHALLGENGSGKTTLCNILSGFYQPDSGEIVADGQRVHFTSPADAHKAGIFMVH